METRLTRSERRRQLFDTKEPTEKREEDEGLQVREKEHRESVLTLVMADLVRQDCDHFLGAQLLQKRVEEDDGLALA